MLAIYTIYWNPADYPDKFVVRRFDVDGNTATPLHLATIHDTIDDARASISPGLFNLRRAFGDEPQIVESWI
jgi:hypothetical protein